MSNWVHKLSGKVCTAIRAEGCFPTQFNRTGSIFGATSTAPWWPQKECKCKALIGFTFQTMKLHPSFILSVVLAQQTVLLQQLQ